MRNEEVADAARELDVFRLVDAMRGKKALHPHRLGSRPAHVADVRRTALDAICLEVELVARVEQSAWILRDHKRVEHADGLFEKRVVARGKRLDGEHARIEEVLPRPADLKRLAVCAEGGPVLPLHALGHFLARDAHRRAVVRHAVYVVLVD